MSKLVSASLIALLTVPIFSCKKKVANSAVKADTAGYAALAKICELWKTGVNTAASTGPNSADPLGGYTGQKSYADARSDAATGLLSTAVDITASTSFERLKRSEGSILTDLAGPFWVLPPDLQWIVSSHSLPHRHLVRRAASMPGLRLSIT